MRRSSIGVSLAGALLVLCGGGPRARGDVVVTDGPARYTLHTDADFTGGAFKPASFEPEGVPGPDHLFESFWAYNAQGLSQNAFFSFGAANVAGDTATIPIGALNQFLNGTLTVTVAHGPGPGQATVTQTLSITNSGSETSDNWRLFHYGDFDLDGDAPANTAAFADADTIRVRRAGSPTVLDFDALEPFSRYEAGAYPALRDSLMGFPADVLDNTGLPFGPGNVTAAYEWDFDLAAGETVTRSIRYAASVPEPVSMTALIPIVAAALSRRRRT
jgi:hypothetical protein